MEVCNVVSSYHRTLEGDGNKIIKKIRNSGIDNFYVLFDNQKELEKEFVKDKYESNVCLYNNDDFETYQFDKPIKREHRWGNHQNPKYFYAHFRMLVFFIKHSDFDYYWFYDDDVDFTGDLKSFLDGYKEEKEDFLAIQAFKKENYPDFPKISIVSNKMKGSHGDWLNMCPGPGDNFKSKQIHMGSFFPIIRFSKNAMKHLMKLHLEGFYGYSEGFVPTSLASDGFKVASMMDENNDFFIKNKTDCKLYHKNIEFTWEWL